LCGWGILFLAHFRDGRNKRFSVSAGPIPAGHPICRILGTLPLTATNLLGRCEHRSNSAALIGLKVQRLGFGFL